MEAVHSSKTQWNILRILPKISENLVVIAWILSSIPNFHSHLWSSHLEFVYNDPSDFAIFGISIWSLPALACYYLLRLCLDLFSGYKMPPFHLEFQFREHIEITGARSGEWAGWATVVMLLFVRNSLTTSEVCAEALSWCNNQSPFFEISGHLHLPFSLSRLKISHQNFPLTIWPDGMNSLCTIPQI